jgi:hypothetical protein
VAAVYRLRPDPKRDRLLLATAWGTLLPPLLIAFMAAYHDAFHRISELPLLVGIVATAPVFGVLLVWWDRRMRRELRLALDERGARLSTQGRVRRQVRWKEVTRARRDAAGLVRLDTGFTSIPLGIRPADWQPESDRSPPLREELDRHLAANGLTIEG